MIVTLKTKLLRANAWVTSVVGIGITIGGITTQPVMSLFRGSISSTGAWVISLGAFYYANDAGLRNYLIGSSLACVACGVVGSPLDLVTSLVKWLCGQKQQPETKVEMVKTTPAPVKEKKGWVASAVKFFSRRFFRLILLKLAILETIFETTFLHKEIVGSNPEERSWFWNQIFEKDEDYYDYEEVYGEEVQNDYPEELWIHVNGIMTELDGAKATCVEIHRLFGRPCKLLHNPTDGLILDLLECFMGKTGLLKHGCTRPRHRLKNSLLMEMEEKKYKKIVLVAHSQGTIITGNVIGDLNDMVANEESTAEDRESMKEKMSKLEVYLVAGAAHHASGKNGVWKDIRGNGITYKHCKDHVDNLKWGHLLGSHYFASMEKGSFSESKLVTEYMLQNSHKQNETQTETETSPLISK